MFIDGDNIGLMVERSSRLEGPPGVKALYDRPLQAEDISCPIKLMKVVDIMYSIAQKKLLFC